MEVYRETKWWYEASLDQWELYPEGTYDESSISYDNKPIKVLQGREVTALIKALEGSRWLKPPLDSAMIHVDDTAIINKLFALLDKTIT